MRLDVERPLDARITLEEGRVTAPSKRLGQPVGICCRGSYSQLPLSASSGSRAEGGIPFALTGSTIPFHPSIRAREAAFAGSPADSVRDHHGAHRLSRLRQPDFH